jgi:Glycosyl hydrolase family 79, N-terminal domain
LGRTGSNSKIKALEAYMTLTFSLKTFALGATILCALANPTRAQNVVTARVGTAPGTRIPADFVGFSFEKSSALPQIFSKNSQILPLVQLLGKSGSIRVGGITSDRGTVPSAKQIQDTAEFMAAIPGWSLIYGLSLEPGASNSLAEEAKALAASIKNPLYFQLGNEPDGYGRTVAGQAPKQAYGPDKYISQWLTAHDIIKAAVPTAKFMGPDIATDTQWFEQTLSSPIAADLSEATQHFYELGPAGRPNVTVQNLLALNAKYENGPALAEVQAAARAHLKLRISEFNSVFGGGQAGVSDVAASAIWGLASMMKLSEIGVVGVNLHGGLGGFYSPQARNDGGSYSPRPIYYAMLMFSRLQGGRILPVTAEPNNNNLAFLSTKNDDNSVDVLVVNKNITTAASVDLTNPGPWSKASALELLTPACSGPRITLGGSTVQDNGSWTPQYVPLAKKANLARVSVPPCGAELIRFE